MKQLFAVVRSRGPAWNNNLIMDDQADWPAHASFMDDLVDEGFVALGGPLVGSSLAVADSSWIIGLAHLRPITTKETHAENRYGR
jgi:hypothetical protein